jgi:hypothetical protein
MIHARLLVRVYRLPVNKEQVLRLMWLGTLLAAGLPRLLILLTSLLSVMTRAQLLAQGYRLPGDLQQGLRLMWLVTLLAAKQLSV